MALRSVLVRPIGASPAYLLTRGLGVFGAAGGGLTAGTGTFGITGYDIVGAPLAAAAGAFTITGFDISSFSVSAATVIITGQAAGLDYLKADSGGLSIRGVPLLGGSVGSLINFSVARRLLRRRGPR